MALSVTKTQVWAGDLQDIPGGLADVLGGLAGSGADLEFVIARRDPAHPGQGQVFISPIKGKRAEAAAQSAGLDRADSVPTLRVEGPDKPGLGNRMARAMADEGINVRGFSAAVIGNKFVAYIGFDNPADADRAAKALKRVNGADGKAATGRRPATAKRKTRA
jgi:hypothetical protein